MNLSPRLQKVASLVPPGSIVADIGSDHAFLPVYLVEEGICPRVIAGEINEKPYLLASSQVEKRGLADHIQVRWGDGLQVLAPGEADVVVLAGMGGRTIKKILCDTPEVTETIRRFILQPMTEAGELRLWLSRHYFKISAEVLVEEKGRIYEVIVAEHGLEPASTEVTLTLGPRLVAEEHPLLRQHLDVLIARERAILAQIEGRAGLSRENWERLRAVKTRLAGLEGIRACL
ncbi:MAG: class I SAM-dependent methyltransferase [bacterium]|jgi:tRNA (adenine22-N1)-methyltransferase|nr:class I SAM-dependent methyltransferase [Bacillota bacterium]HHW55047.1 SAM-dependent methyltransferase [Bacillota bacterium]